MNKFTVQVSSSTYPVFFEEGIIESSDFLNSFESRIVIITDDHVKDLYAEPILQTLKAMGRQAWLISFPAGDVHKTRETKEKIEDQMQSLKLNRDCEILAIGGGVVLDIAGFIAATYCRGVSFTSVPTTLLAMVDASIGGKTGVNTSFGKNRIGAIYHPKAIFMDPLVLKTLELERIKEGMVEMIKHLLLFDQKSFEKFSEKIDAILNGDLEYLIPEIIPSCMHKKEIIEKDEKETSLRALLNFGHTFGHAFETLSDYQVSHGRAVSCGIMAESYLSFIQGKLSQNHLSQIVECIKKLRFEALPNFSEDQVFEMLLLDKKASYKGVVCWSLEEIGSYLKKPLLCDREEIEKVLRWTFSVKGGLF